MSIDNNINDSRDLALSLVENGQVSTSDLILSLLKYMSTDDVFDCLKVNGLLPDGDTKNYWTYTHPELIELINNYPS
jgi:hypothetical protein